MSKVNEIIHDCAKRIERIVLQPHSMAEIEIELRCLIEGLAPVPEETPTDQMKAFARRIEDQRDAFRTALITIRDECFSGAAYDIAERALAQVSPQKPTVECKTKVGGFCEACDCWVQPGICGSQTGARV